MKTGQACLDTKDVSLTLQRLLVDRFGDLAELKHVFPASPRGRRAHAGIKPDRENLAYWDVRVGTESFNAYVGIGLKRSGRRLTFKPGPRILQLAGDARKRWFAEALADFDKEIAELVRQL